MSVHYELVIRWPEGFGVANRIRSEADIPSAVEAAVRAGYGRKHNPIHVLKVTTPEVVLIKDDAPEKKGGAQ